MTKPQKPNTFDADDLKQIISEIEEMDTEVEDIMASARGKTMNIRARQKLKKKHAREHLGIPMSILSAALKTRKLERQLKKVAEDVPEDLAEVWVDAAGQFSLFKPVEGEPADTAAVAAAKAHAEKAKAHHDQEQAEGEAALNELATA